MKAHIVKIHGSQCSVAANRQYRNSAAIGMAGMAVISMQREAVIGKISCPLKEKVSNVSGIIYQRRNGIMNRRESMWLKIEL